MKNSIFFTLVGLFAFVSVNAVNSMHEESCATYMQHYVNGKYSHTTGVRKWSLSCSGTETLESHSSVSIMMQ